MGAQPGATRPSPRAGPALGPAARGHLSRPLLAACWQLAPRQCRLPPPPPPLRCTTFYYPVKILQDAPTEPHSYKAKRIAVTRFRRRSLRFTSRPVIIVRGTQRTEAELEEIPFPPLPD